ncbi:tetratricopeptide repeat protein [Trinickia fusca]|nr:tetratricopeptide repeat protein [Trinickia fusca]
MKSSSGRMPRTAALAATVLIAFTLAALPSAAVHAATGATNDGTPEIDASIAAQNWRQALTQLDARIAAEPRDAQAKFKRGTVLVHLDRDDDAIRQFTELTQSYPELPEPYNNLAALYAKAGRYEEARAALETAVKANPGYGLAYENLGDLYLRLAEQSYKRAQGLGHTSATTAQRLADIAQIVSPTHAAKPTSSKRANAPASFVIPSSPPALPSPSVQFGTGPNGSLALPPYVAPSY